MKSDLTNSPVWQALSNKAQNVSSLQELFTNDTSRAKNFTFALDDDFFIDFSKQPVDSAILDQLIHLAQQQDVQKWRDAMFAGDAINFTENRAVLHVALRGQRDDDYSVQGKPVMPDVLAIRERMVDFATRVREGHWRGATGKTIKTVINIGIGGSALGPELIVRSLRAFHDGPDVRFLNNIDPADLSHALDQLDPETTLFIIASKTFTTQETITNAKVARRWLIAALGKEAVGQHFVAASTNQAEVESFGIKSQNMFPYWDWVGGRFSVWASVGLSVMLAVGPKNFLAFLDGARDMDVHFRTAPLAQNLPVLMALCGIWNRNFLNRSSLAILPYSEDLQRLPLFLQQLEMESNGKSINREGQEVTYPTCPVVFGQPGTNGQHAFHQQLHQGPEVVPCDLIIALTAHPQDEELAPGQHRQLVANALAQAAALMSGRQHDQPERSFPGNRPSTMIVMEALTPRNLGRLVALYEHKVAVQGWVWEVNSFDQFGVELGKELATALLNGTATRFDSSTLALFSRLDHLSRAA